MLKQDGGKEHLSEAGFQAKETETSARMGGVCGRRLGQVGHAIPPHLPIHVAQLPIHQLQLGGRRPRHVS